MKKIVKIIKSFIAAPFLIYFYNLIALPYNLIVPINFFSVFVIGLLGLPGLFTILILFICV